MPLRSPTLLAVAGLLAACSGETDTAEFHGDMCRRVELIDQLTGTHIVGAEDLALDEAGGALIVSAYDRRKAEKAAGRNGDAPAQGGLYSIELARLFEAREDLKIMPLLDAEKFKNGLRPHGVAFDPATKQIAFINREYVKQGRKWGLSPVLINISSDGNIQREDIHCAANDVAIGVDRTLVTFDHKDCDSIFIDDVFNRKQSGAFLVNGETLIDDLGFANGAAKMGEGFVIAATRDNAVYLFEAHEGLYFNSDVIHLPGAPDNISVTNSGEVVAAIHRSLFRLALNRKLGFGRSPSQLIAIDPDTAATRVLFEDRNGAMFSAATVGVLTEQGLIAGSVTDRGLLVCSEAR